MQKRTIPSREIEEKNAMERAAVLCSQRECCISQIEEKLIGWGQSAEACERIISYLIKERFIDERRFCQAYALDKMRYNHWGRQKINMMLRQLGLPTAEREEALRLLPDDEYREILHRLIEQKLPAIHARTDYERKGKLMRYLAGRGFGLDEVASEVENL